MASTSRGASAQRNPDVFVNFRGRDTRYNFISHLLGAMQRNGISAYTDDELRGGEEISPTLSNKISESPVSVAVFSPNYANSWWCLDELVQMIQRKRENSQIVQPVFLQGVEPTHVRRRTGPFGDGFKKLIARGPAYECKKEIWADALEQAANLSSGAFEHSSEAEIIEKLVNRVLSILGKKHPSDNHSNFFGAHRIEEVESILFSEEVSCIGIWGMGGLGKTTLAKKIMDRNSSKFNGVCFIENVREYAEKKELDRLQKKLLSKLLGKRQLNETTQDIHDKHTKFRLSRISVLIILDDVSDAGQIEAVIGNWQNYGEGRKMIATSRDRQVLKNVCDNHLYEVQALDDWDSLQLLKHHMFKMRQPTPEQIELLQQTIKHAQGLPLALEVLGRNLYNRDITFWRSELERLNDIPTREVMDILRSSFDRLQDMEKSIFLDIACLLPSCREYNREDVINTHGSYAESSIDRLVDKSLVTVNQNRLWMHDFLQQMGNEIGKGSRLSKPKEIIDVLSKDVGTGHKTKIEVIWSSMSTNKRFKLWPNAFKGMTSLRILCLTQCGGIKILPQESLEDLPNELRWLEWDYYPYPSLPLCFDPENLVELHMTHSNLVELWKGEVELLLPNLKCIDISYSKMLAKLPNLGSALNLEKLLARKCHNLAEIPNSVGHLLKLKELDFKYAERLTWCPDLLELTKLESLNFKFCRNITKLPQLPQNFFDSRLQDNKLSCSGCSELKSLPSNIGELKYITCLDISECSKLQGLPISVGDLQFLKILCASKSGLICLPKEIKYLTNLVTLELDDTKLESLPEEIKHLSNLEILNLCNTKLKSLPDSIRNLAKLEKLDLSHTNLGRLPDSIKNLAKLEELDLSHTNLRSLPDSIKNLAKLEKLDLSHTKLGSLPDNIKHLAKLEKLDLSHTYLKSLPDSIKHLAKLEKLDLSHTNLGSLPDSIKDLSNLEILNLSNTKLKSLPDSIKHLAKLEELDLSYTNLGSLPDNIKHLAKLEKLDLSHTNLRSLPDNIKHLAKLEKLDLSHTNLGSLPDSIKDLAKLEKLDLSHTNLRSLPEEIKHLSNLQALFLCHSNLEILPEGIQHLANLYQLCLSYTNLKGLPHNIKHLANLRDLGLSYTSLEILPEEIKHLTQLNSLNLSGTKLKSLPDGIKHMGCLYIELFETNLESLPDGLKHLANLEVSELPHQDPKDCHTSWLRE